MSPSQQEGQTLSSLQQNIAREHDRIMIEASATEIAASADNTVRSFILLAQVSSEKLMPNRNMRCGLLIHFKYATACLLDSCECEAQHRSAALSATFSLLSESLQHITLWHTNDVGGRLPDLASTATG